MFNLAVHIFNDDAMMQSTEILQGRLKQLILNKLVAKKARKATAAEEEKTTSKRQRRKKPKMRITQSFHRGELPLRAVALPHLLLPFHPRTPTHRNQKDM